MNPSKPSLDYIALRDKRELVWDLWEGTKAMRARGAEYLPRWANEEEAEYQFRLALAYLPPQWRRNIEMLAGKPFAKPMDVTGGNKAWVDAFSGNVDAQGMPLEVFAKRCFTTAQRDGLAGILIDAPQLPSGARLSEAEAAGGPFFEEVNCRRVIDADHSFINGRRRLTQLRITGWETEPDPDDQPYGTRYFPTVRVYQRVALQGGGSQVSVTKYRSKHVSMHTVLSNPWAVDIGTDDWATMSTVTLSGVTEIPFVFMFGPSEHGPSTADPTYLDFAFVALQQYQSTADQRNILHVARVPILFGAGFNAADKLVIAPLRFIGHPNATTTLNYVEPKGTGIAAGEKDLERLEMAIAMMGIEPMVTRPKYKTATEDSNDVVEQESPLQSSARMMAAALQKALAFASQFVDSRVSGVTNPTETTFKVDIFLEFGVSFRSAEELRALVDSRKNGDITRLTLITEFRRRGVLAESLDPEAEAKAATAEEDAALEKEAALVNNAASTLASEKDGDATDVQPHNE